MTPKAKGAATTAATALLLAGCGSGERVFEPEELVTELNGSGANIKLGPILTTNPDGVDVTSVFVADPAGQGDLGAGTMVLLEDTEAARDEFARCESTPSLICFRAANGVLRFEELLPAGQAQVEVALREIETAE